MAIAKSGPQAELNELWQLLLEYTAWERCLPMVGFQILMCMSLCVCMQKTINALWIPIVQHALKWHLIQLEDYIAPLKVNAKKQRGTKIPFVKRWQSRLKCWKGQRALCRGQESASIHFCCTIVQSLVSQSASSLCQHKHGQNIAPRFSHGPGLLTSILSVPHCDAEVLIHVIRRRAWVFYISVGR